MRVKGLTSWGENTWLEASDHPKGEHSCSQRQTHQGKQNPALKKSLAQPQAQRGRPNHDKLPLKWAGCDRLTHAGVEPWLGVDDVRGPQSLLGVELLGICQGHVEHLVQGGFLLPARSDRLHR